jgi:predicted DNA-binding protein
MSFRLDEELAERLAAAARHRGVTESEFIRQAVAQAIETARPRTLREALADVIGSVHGDGSGYSRRVDEVVLEEIEKDRRRWNRLDPDRR